MRRAAKNKTTAALISDSEAAFDSDSASSIASNSSPRRNRKVWCDAEEACLISGVEKVMIVCFHYILDLIHIHIYILILACTCPYP